MIEMYYYMAEFDPVKRDQPITLTEFIAMLTIAVIYLSLATFLLKWCTDEEAKK